MTEKRYNVWDIDGTIFLEDHKEGSYHIGQAGNVDINCLNDIADRLNELHEGNQELKSFNKDLAENLSACANARISKDNRIERLEERNNRQAKQLDNLYTLIEKQDWKTLKGLIQEFQECEEQIQQEWGTYGDVE